ncbi:MAG: ATP synthase F1 subunit epsilon [Azospirillum sp.]|nr:ATP synthase F1 subunit epsilon [Azospirillum sp.]
MSNKVEFELVSPERLLVSQPVDMVVVPGTEGYFGVLYDHIPVMATLRSGVIDIYEGNRVADRIFIDGGFCEVSHTTCTVLVETAIKLVDIDPAKAQQEYENLKEDLEDAKTEIERTAIGERLEIARTKVESVTGQPVKL